MGATGRRVRLSSQQSPRQDGPAGRCQGGRGSTYHARHAPHVGAHRCRLPIGLSCNAPPYVLVESDFRPGSVARQYTIVATMEAMISIPPAIDESTPTKLRATASTTDVPMNTPTAIGILTFLLLASNDSATAWKLACEPLCGGAAQATWAAIPVALAAQKPSRVGLSRGRCPVGGSGSPVCGHCVITGLLDVQIATLRRRARRRSFGA